MIYIVLNVLPIFAAMLAGLGFGLGYYVLADRAGALRFAVDPAKLLPWAALAVAAEFWLAAILAGALILAPPEAAEWTMALGSALVIWIGFVVPVLLVTLSYRGLSPRAALIDCAHWLGVMTVQAVVLQTIGLKPPPP